MSPTRFAWTCPHCGAGNPTATASGCYRCRKPGPQPIPSFADDLLAAQSDEELDAAFAVVFEMVQAVWRGGTFDDCDSLLRWIQEPSRVHELHVEMLLACIRVTFPIREALEHWTGALEAISKELEVRGEDVAALLCGLASSRPLDSAEDGRGRRRPRAEPVSETQRPILRDPRQFLVLPMPRQTMGTIRMDGTRLRVRHCRHCGCHTTIPLCPVCGQTAEASKPPPEHDLVPRPRAPSHLPPETRNAMQIMLDTQAKDRRRP